ncbi:bifunctional diguanylate cyclase/phosphodiesterase [Exilibacterium tricleocarpae]|nr:EAL domain-containing protein [Exilibacterium tricleocarpae]
MIKQSKSIEFKLNVGFAAIVLGLIGVITLVLQFKLRAELEDDKATQLQLNGEVLIAELNRQIGMINTLALSVAEFAASAPPQRQLFNQVLPDLIDLTTSQSLVAGGGFWPEPYAFDADTERASFFWGRTTNNNLMFFDDYNDPRGNGYHRQQWYVAARHLPKGQCYWSQSYVDPHSNQSMVTCTVAVHKDKKFIGAATIDLRLEGLSAFFREHTRDTDGYAFAVDQDNRFITYPETSWIKKDGAGDNYTVAELAGTLTALYPIAAALDKLNADIIARARRSTNGFRQIAGSLTDSSPQVSTRNAQIMAAALLRMPDWQGLNTPTLSINNDPLFKEPVNVGIFLIPDTLWKIVVVTPISKNLLSTDTIIGDTLKSLLVPVVILVVLCFIALRHVVIRPLRTITNTLKKETTNTSNEFNLLDENRKDEFGQMAYWYNRRNQELASAMDKLYYANSELAYHASYDPLTNLSNRREFENQLEQLAKSDQWKNYALLFLDLDQFKVINDTCGHLAGDQLLTRVGRKLTMETRDNDIVSRFGGDEFGILTCCEDIEHAGHFAERIRFTIEKAHFSWENQSYAVTCSIGVVHLGDIPADKTTALRYSDNACYAAKDAGRNQVHCYHSTDQLVMQREGEMNWLFKIRDAVKANKLFIEYQPIISLKSHQRKIVALEALIRMRGSDGATVLPSAFLPAAERYSAMLQVDKWVIKEALKTLSQWRPVMNNIEFISINLSAETLCHASLLPFIESNLKEYPVDPSKLCFEVTETHVMINLEAARATLLALRGLGCKIALDDFGAGMSSFGYLRELPVDIVKIDGAFVRDMATDSVHYEFVKSIHNVAQVMSLRTIAEFVEDENTINLLDGIGIHYAQGYAIDKPQSWSIVATMITNDNIIAFAK